MNANSPDIVPSVACVAGTESAMESFGASRIRGGRRAGAAGFSLIEVVIALGIVSSVLVALLALFGYGMDSMKEATDTAIEARVAQTIISDIQAANFEDMQRFETQRYYYDGDGTRVINLADAIYIAQVDVLSQGTNPVQLPGMKNNDLLQKVNIRIGRFPGGNVRFADEEEGRVWNQFTTVVVDLRRENVRNPGS